MKKVGLVIIVALCVVAFFHYNLNHWLTLDGMQSGLDQFKAWRDQSPWLVGGAYFAIYVLVTALSLPGALVMTLAGGALFGLLWGTLLISFASSFGASLAFLASRYLLRDWVQGRFGKRLTVLNDGIKRDGAFYLFTLRLVPIFPFFLINLLMGLTPLPALTFYWVSQVGMLAGTLVYVNAGTQLAQLTSLSGILSPALLASFVLIGVFPIVMKKCLGWFKARRVYQGYKKPAKFDRNLIVIGAGAGGLVSAYIAATVKAKVTLVEAHKMGGDCLNYGCVPSKTLIKSAKVAQQIRHATQYGLNTSHVEVSLSEIAQRIQAAIQRIEPHDSIERYSKLGVDVVQGYARLIDPWTVSIERHDGETQTLTSRSIILATGSKPVVPDIPGLSDVGFLTSDTLWERLGQLETLPKRLVVLGGGPIGCELSQSFARLGANVMQIERSERLLSREDRDASLFAQQQLVADGVQVFTHAEVLRVMQEAGEKFVLIQQGDQTKRLPFDEIICAIGREARLQGYGLEELGIETKRTIVTDEYLATLYPNIYAAGDVAGPYQFTHVAAHQAWYAAVNALFGGVKRFRADYRVIPWTTFIDPEIARVGLNEQDAQQQGISYEVTRFELDELDRAIVEGAARGFIKVLTVPNKDTILGVTIVGEHAGEIMAEFVLAMKHGLGLNKLLATIHTYPTWAEANKYVAGEWKRKHAPKRLLSWLEKYHAWRRG